MKTRNFSISPLLLVVAGIGFAVPAMAQDVEGAAPEDQPPEFQRNRSTPVAGRTPQGYSPDGIHFGSFIFHPQLAVGADFTDNVYASRRNQRSDIALNIAPSATLASVWTRHSLNLSVGANYNQYANTPNENFVDYNGRLDGVYSIDSRTSLTASALGRRDTQRRGDIGSADAGVDPVRYTTLGAGLGIGWENGRIRLTANGNVNRVRYDDTEDDQGNLVTQDYRNMDSVFVSLAAEYAITPNFAVKLQANRTNYDYKPIQLTGISRDSETTEVLLGASFEFTDFLRGEFGLGYIEHNYDSALYKSFNGFGARAQFEYFPTELTTLTFSGSRTVEVSGQRLSPNYLLTSFGLTVDHELYRNFIVSASTTYSNSRYDLPHRDEKRLTLRASARYLVNRIFSINPRVEHLRVRTSPSSLGRRFDVNRLMVDLTIKY